MLNHDSIHPRRSKTRNTPGRAIRAAAERCRGGVRGSALERLRRVSRDRPGADWSLKTEGYREMRRRGELLGLLDGSAQTREGMLDRTPGPGPWACAELRSRRWSRSSALPASLCSSPTKDEQAARPCPCDLSAEAKDSPNADTRKHEHNLQGMGQPA